MDPKTGRPNVETGDVTVDVPPGVESGMSMQVAGKGASGDQGMPPGDLFIEFSVDSDPYFKRDPERAEDVHVEVNGRGIVVEVEGTAR